MKESNPKKTQAVRDVLTKAAKPLRIDHLQPLLERKMKQVVGKEKLYQLLAGMKKDGEIDTVGRADDCWYHLLKRKAA